MLSSIALKTARPSAEDYVLRPQGKYSRVCTLAIQTNFLCHDGLEKLNPSNVKGHVAEHVAFFTTILALMTNPLYLFTVPHSYQNMSKNRHVAINNFTMNSLSVFLENLLRVQ